MPEITLLSCPKQGCNSKVSVFEEYFHGISYAVLCRCGARGPKCATEEAAIAAWNALPRHLHWTSEPPKVEGWYWQMMIDAPQSITIAEVSMDRKGVMRSRSVWGNRQIEKFEGFLWAGPIPEPEEK